MVKQAHGRGLLVKLLITVIYWSRRDPYEDPIEVIWTMLGTWSILASDLVNPGLILASDLRTLIVSLQGQFSCRPQLREFSG